MEKSLRYAIEKAKRNIRDTKYSKIENVLYAIFDYDIALEEVDVMIKSINKWVEKHNNDDTAENYLIKLNGGIYDAHDVESIIEYMKQTEEMAKWK